MNFTDLRERIAISGEFTPEERDFLLDAVNAAIPEPGVVHDPGNYMGRIESIWAFLSVDDGGEGVCGVPIGGSTLPMIAADKRRLDQLKPFARALVNVINKPVRLVKFGTREDVEIYRCK